MTSLSHRGLSPVTSLTALDHYLTHVTPGCWCLWKREVTGVP